MKLPRRQILLLGGGHHFRSQENRLRNDHALAPHPTAHPSLQHAVDVAPNGFGRNTDQLGQPCHSHGAPQVLRNWRLIERLLSPNMTDVGRPDGGEDQGLDCIAMMDVVDQGQGLYEKI